MTRIASGLPMRQTQASPSLTLALARSSAFGENVKLTIGPRVCCSVVLSSCVARSQTLTSGEGPPVANHLPSGLVAMDRTDSPSGTQLGLADSCSQPWMAVPAV